MNLGYLQMEVRRVLRDRVTLFFIAILPSFFYLIFGAAQDYSKEEAGNGNVAFYIMVGMAAYGATTATAGIGGMAAVERSQGWGRQLGLTPLRDRQYVATKTALAVIVAMIPISLTYLLGVVTGAQADLGVWMISAVVLVAGSVVWALYGLCFGLAFRSEAAVSAASGILVLLSFLGNIFLPLSGLMLDIARFTPLYGYVALARYPLTEGLGIDGAGNQLARESLWVPIANVSVWAVFFAVLATWLVHRGRGRQ